MAGESARFGSLDGLRGVAAAVVVVFHVVVSNDRAGAIYKLTETGPLSTFETVMNYSPLRILWAGSEAVVVFYVLSGFVLALPFARGAAVPWKYFYPRRLLRLYVPSIASLVFAYLTTLAIRRAEIPNGSPWLNDHAAAPNGPVQVLLGSSLIAGWGGLNTSLWSLRYEVLFSLLLPLFLWVAFTWKRLLWLKVAAVPLFCMLWPLAGFFYPDLVYLSVFLLGVLMAYNIEALRARAARIRGWGWTLICGASILLLCYSWLVAGVDPESRWRQSWIGFAAIGATLLVFAVAFWRPCVRAFGSRPIRWLGRISFSLYLTQEPVVVALAFATHGLVPLWVQIPVGFALSLFVAWLFYLVVERPSHRLSRNFARARQQRELAAAAVPVGAPRADLGSSKK